MSQMETEFPGQFIHVDTHVSGDLFFGSEASARGSRYGVSGIPDVWFDGLVRNTGAGSCAAAASTYRNRINARIAATSGLSPIDVDVVMEVAGGMATITGTAELVDDVTLPALQMTLFVVEDPVVECCDSQGNDTYKAVSRGIRSNPITLTFGGGTVDVVESWPVDASWNADNIYAVAVVENVSAPREIHNAEIFRSFLRIAFDTNVVSIPDANGTVEVTGTITNGNDDGDNFDLSVSSDLAWAQEFQLEGDPTWYTNTTIFLNSGEDRGVTFRVTTDGTAAKANSYLTANGAVFSATGTLRIFNGSPSILLVDAETSGEWEQAFEDAVDQMGFFYDYNESPANGGPLFNLTNGYDLVIWHTGYSSAAMGADQGAGLVEYLNNGGNLLLSSMQFNAAQGNTPALQALLGIDSIVANGGSDFANGVNGDPISDGMAWDLVWPQPSANRSDDITPTATAAVVFTDSDGDKNTIRHELVGGNRTVYCSIVQDVFDDGKIPVAEAMINWLVGGLDPADVNDAPFVSKVMGVSPNPFRNGTDLSFALSDWAAQMPVSVKVVDASGRLVRNLFQGNLEAGSHNITWDGNDSNGRSVANGLYFGIVRNADGEQRAKIVRMAD